MRWASASPNRAKGHVPARISVSCRYGHVPARAGQQGMLQPEFQRCVCSADEPHWAVPSMNSCGLCIDGDGGMSVCQLTHLTSYARRAYARNYANTKTKPSMMRQFRPRLMWRLCLRLHLGLLRRCKSADNDRNVDNDDNIPQLTRPFYSTSTAGMPYRIPWMTRWKKNPL